MEIAVAGFDYSTQEEPGAGIDIMTAEKLLGGAEKEVMFHGTEAYGFMIIDIFSHEIIVHQRAGEGELGDKNPLNPPFSKWETGKGKG
jgi:hypothetical protein